MEQILLILIVLTVIMKWLIIADVILSWLAVFGLNIRIKFIRDLLDPIYERIKNTIPTTFGPFELAPIILFLFLAFIQGAIGAYDYEIILKYKELTNF